MTLGDLVARLPGAVLTGDRGLLVTEVTHDSRRSGPGALFVAIRGFATDGNSFAGSARKKGAVAVCSEQPPAPDTPWVQVADAREALAVFSAAVRNEVTGPTILEMLYELDRMRVAAVTDEELLNAKTYSNGTLSLEMETQAGLAPG